MSASASSTGRRSCSSTSRRPASTRRRAPGCGTRSATCATLGTTVFLTTHYLEEADALADRLAIIDHGAIVAEGTADELKRQVAGDVVTIGVDGAVEHVLEAVRAQPFVREATAEDELVRLYVDRGDDRRPAAPPRPRWRRAARPSRSPSTGPASTTSSSARPAARCATRAGRLSRSNRPHRKETRP